MAPVTLNVPLLTSPLKPESTEPALKVMLTVVNVPVPDSAPLTVIPVGKDGFAPRGNEQLLLTVFVPAV